MDALVRAGRGIVERAPEPPRAAAPAFAAPAFAAPAAPALAEAEDAPRVRSQAERDLLKALRMAR